MTYLSLPLQLPIVACRAVSSLLLTLRLGPHLQMLPYQTCRLWILKSSDQTMPQERVFRPVCVSYLKSQRPSLGLPVAGKLPWPMQLEKKYQGKTAWM